MKQWLRIDRSKGSTKLRAALPEEGSRASFRNVEFVRKFIRRTKSNKWATVSESYTNVKACGVEFVCCGNFFSYFSLSNFISKDDPKIKT